jgi:hypothetical protein
LIIPTTMLGQLRCIRRIVKAVAEREGFEPSMGLLPNRISNWTPKRDRRDSQGVLRSDAGVSRNSEA